MYVTPFVSRLRRGPGSPRPRPIVRPAVRSLLTVVITAAAVAGSVATAASDAGSAVVYEPPVDADVTDPFRPPAHFAGPGNRGLEYGTSPGAEVRAAADGTVVFAGPVADSLHVTILHADGIRTSYSFVASVAVSVGETVRRGQVVATAGTAFHFGARDGDTYIDPAGLFAPVRRARLVTSRQSSGGDVVGRPVPGAGPTSSTVAAAIVDAVEAAVGVVVDRLAVWSR